MDEIEERINVPVVTVESRDFFDLMQSYRHAPIVPPQGPAEAYQEVIKHVDGLIQPLIERVVALRAQYAEIYNNSNSDDEKQNAKELVEGIDAELAALVTK